MKKFYSLCVCALAFGMLALVLASPAPALSPVNAQPILSSNVLASPLQLNLALSANPSGVSLPAPLSTIQCDGDGVSGQRVQLIYAHASDVPDSYAANLALFRQWMADADAIFQNSAALTGGTRHIRFVTDANCNLVIPNLTLSPAGDDTFSNTIWELVNIFGLGRTDRKYVVFVDSHAYCGISNVIDDDQPGVTNANNWNGSWVRIDAGCWSGIITAHELIHSLGGVQLSAPHASGDYHCTDGADLMCRPANGAVVQSVCPDNSTLDCNQDDYFSANPVAGSYLTTHWNTANSIFLIGAPTPPPTPSPTPLPTMTPTPAPTKSPTRVPPTATPLPAKSVRVDSVVTGKTSGKTFTATDTFKPSDTVVARIHVVNQSQANFSGATVAFIVKKPDGSTQCALSVKTDASGNAQGSCAIPKNAPKGAWQVQVNQVTASGYSYSATTSVTTHTFTVQ